MPKLATCPLGQNNLLRTLPASDRATLEPLLQSVELGHRMVLSMAGQTPRHVYFPTSGVGSVIALGRGGRRIEAGLFGNEGMSATELVLGSDRAPTETVMQVAGSGFALEADIFRELLGKAPSLRHHLMLYAQTLFVQTSQTALSNGHAKLEERLARWLLMCHDRIFGDVLELTHEFLSVMLGVRRAGVTVATHLLEGKGLVRAERGRIEILDRSGLEEAAQGTYGVPEAEYDRLFGRGP